MSSPKASVAPAIPEQLRDKTWGLADVVDVALRNNPATRVAWAGARAAAAGYGVERAAYFPAVNLSAEATDRRTTKLSGSATDNSTSATSAGPSVGLSWLLLDFGGRSASLENARQVLLAANWTQNAAIQGVVLSVEQAYYSYMAAKAARNAGQSSLEDAELNLTAAQTRHDAGVATIADVLQAKTAAAQARLVLQTTEGQIQTTRGALSASMGLPANLPIDIEELPRDVPLEGLSAKVDDLIAEALGRRPDLAAAQAQALASEANVKRVESQGLPTVGLSASTGLSFLDQRTGGNESSGHQESYTAGLLLQVPLFTGYAQTYGVKRAQAQAEAARQQRGDLEQQVIFQVVSAYYGLQTATAKVRTTDDLLASAQQSVSVALGRYREGVGTILDLVAAQSALANARAQWVQSRFEWYVALAQLAHDTGLLGLRGETPLAPGGDGGPGEQK